jgi:hypothetical protein
MSLESGNEALEVERWSRRRNPKEEEEGVFIPTSPELAVGGFLRPGRVTRLPPVPSRVAQPLMPVDPVGLEGEGLITKGLILVFRKIFLGFALLEKMREDHKKHL